MESPKSTESVLTPTTKPSSSRRKSRQVRPTGVWSESYEALDASTTPSGRNASGARQRSARVCRSLSSDHSARKKRARKATALTSWRCLHPKEARQVTGKIGGVLGRLTVGRSAGIVVVVIRRLRVKWMRRVNAAMTCGRQARVAKLKYFAHPVVHFIRCEWNRTKLVRKALVR